MVGWDMLQARLSSSKVSASEVKSYVSDISVTPLAIPMICGPAAITNAIVMMEDASSFELQAALLFGMAAVMLLTLCILLSATKIIHFLGETGNKVMMRLMGL